MGAHHVRIYKMLSACCELIGIYDVDKELARRVASANETRCFESIDELLAQAEAISIAVPTAYHYETAKIALERYVHVLVEKPIAQNVEQGRMLMELADKNGLVLQVGHVERFNPAVQILPEILKDKKIYALEFRRLSPFDERISDMDVVQDLMIHDIDVLRFLMPQGIINIDAVGVSPRSKGYIDYAVASLMLEGGITASLTASRVTQQKIRKAAITTEDAYVEMDFMERKIMISRAAHGGFGGGSEPSYRQESIVEKVFVPNHEPLLKELESFLRCVKENKKPEISASDGVAALNIVQAIQQKMYKKILNGLRFL
jgi:predicted dehydrogenase